MKFSKIFNLVIVLIFAVFVVQGSAEPEPKGLVSFLQLIYILNFNWEILIYDNENISDFVAETFIQSI